MVVNHNITITVLLSESTVLLMELLFYCFKNNYLFYSAELNH